MAVFTVRVVTDPDALDQTTMLLGGEIDLAAHDEVISVGKRALARRTTLRVELSGVTFIDSTGLSALIALMAEAEVAGAHIEFDNVTPRIKRLFELVGVDDMFPESRTEASSSRQAMNSQATNIGFPTGMEGDR